MKLQLHKYSWKALGGDAMGALVASLIALPYGLALASLMGLPPILGVYTSILTAPVLVLFGRNPVLIGGPSSVTVPFIAAACAQQGVGGAAKVSIVASIFMMCFGVMRLGRYVSKLPMVVVSGFSCGIGAMMVLSQVPTLLGVSVEREGSTVAFAAGALARIDELQPAALSVGLTVIIVAALTRRAYPASPAPLAGVVAAAVVAALIGWRGMEVGPLPQTLPPFVGFSWSPADVYEVFPAAFALAVVTSINLLITSRVVEHFRGCRRRLKKADADAELGAYSMANLAAGVFGAPMSVGIPARSLANVRCGGTTRLSNLLHAVYLAAFLLFAREWIEAIPMPALAGVTAWMGLALLDWSTWQRLHLMRRHDAAAFALTAFATPFVNAVIAVGAGYLVHSVGQALSKGGLSQPAPEKPLEPSRQRSP